MPRPFEPNERLSREHIEMLRDWLEKECRQNLALAKGYTIADLIVDLDNILDGMWNDDNA